MGSFYKLGLTGSVGVGKTTVSSIFSELDIPVFDADRATNEIYVEESVSLIMELFPAAVRNGVVCKEALWRILQNDKDAWDLLDSVVHPLVFVRERDFINDAVANGYSMAVLCIPLLFECGRDKEMDSVLVITVDAKIQSERVLARSGMTEKKFKALLSRQMPDSEKIARADFVVDTSMGIKSVREEVIGIVAAIQP